MRTQSWRRKITLYMASFQALLCAGCSSPSASVSQWAVTRDGEGRYQLTITGALTNGNPGWFALRLDVIDERGCSVRPTIEEIQPLTGADPNNLTGTVQRAFVHPWRLARANLAIVHQRGSDPSNVSETEVFTGATVVDPAVQPPAPTAANCTEAAPAPQRRATREELRRRARTDPDGADAEAIGQMSREEMVATAINTAGFLCARVTLMEARGGVILVNCIEYRNGTGRARYRVDANAGTVDRLD